MPRRHGIDRLGAPSTAHEEIVVFFTSRTYGVLVLLLAAAASAPPAAAADPLAAAIASPARTPKYVARDVYRHPAETLKFFG